MIKVNGSSGECTSDNATSMCLGGGSERLIFFFSREKGAK